LSGIERADSLAIDPHKWLFSPLDCSALLYRDPSLARLTFTQRAEYIEALRESEGWNPSDYGSHFTRRCRGLPFWFMLAVHGSEAVAAEIDYCLDLAQTTARLIDTCPSLELVMEPELSIVLFRRLGWTMADYQAWCDDLLARNVAFIVPTHVERGPALRFCFVNPLTTVEDVQHILAALA
jgi:glutamate/tyrosine decarboxylase-like PLP-dependent enzyme